MNIEQEFVSVRIRIVRAPDPVEFAEFDLEGLRVGEVVDVAPRLATLLLIAGTAELPVSTTNRAEAADAASARRTQPKPNPPR